MTRLESKVAFITGGAGGIGRATAEKFLREGAKVVIGDLDEGRVERVVAELGSAGHQGSIAGTRVDVADHADLERAVDGAAETFGRLDVMFNNAGIAGGRPLLEHDPAIDYRPMIRIDQDGVYHGILVAARRFVKQGTRGVIINTSSVYGEAAAELAFSYGAAKAAVISFTRSAAYELALHGIRVVAIAPGRVATPIILQFPSELTALFASEQLRDALTRPEEVADVVAFLASDESNAINGTVVHVDDGYSTFKQRFELPVF